MANFLRLLTAVLLFPMVYVFGVVLVNSVSSVYSASDLNVVNVVSFFVGGIVFLLLWFFSPPYKTYVLGHELTHAITAKLFGAKVSNIKVAANGGSVLVSKSNMMITLSPYFFPFYTLLLTLVLGVTSLFVSPIPYAALWFALGGFTWFFHVCFTVDSLMHHQPDIREYGRVFSYVFIWFFNVACVLLFLVALTGLTLKQVAHDFWNTAAAGYISVYEFICSLPFLQN